MKKLSLKYLLLTVFLLGYASSYAYDAVGHRIITEIAYKNLSCKAKRHVDKTLGKRGIIYYSSWADEIKSDSTYSATYQWHYQNLPAGLPKEDIIYLTDNPASEGQHIFYALDILTKQLKQDKHNQEALKFFVHLVGDLHQPMHMGRPEDLGGNKLPVQWFSRKTNLHAIWDSSVTESRKMSSSEYATYLMDKYEPVKKQYKKYTLLQSVEKTYSLSNEIYAYGNEFNKPYHYIYRFINEAEEQMYIAGIQLANLLNQIYK